jgi:hypothetical protein
MKMTVIRMLLTLLVVHAESSLNLLSDGLHLDGWWNGRSLELRREDKSVVGADGMTREGFGTCDVGVGMGICQCGWAWRGEDVGWRMEDGRKRK